MANEKGTRKNNGQGSVFKNKDGKWISKICDGKNKDGSPHIKSFTSKTKKEAVEKLDNYKMLMKNGYHKQSELSVRDYLTNWLKNVKSKTLVDTSWSYLRNIVDVHIIREIGHIRMKDLTTNIIQEQLINKLIEDEYSYSLISKVHNVMSQCLEYAFLQKHIETNYCKLVTIPNRNNFVSTKKKYTIWNDDEVSRFLDECFAVNPCTNQLKNYYGTFMAFLLLTGLRIGELLGLKWECVDLEKRTIKIERIVTTARYNQEEGKYERKIACHERTKTKTSNRTIPLCQKAYDCLMIMKENREIMLNQKDIRKDFINEGYVFVNKCGNISYSDDIRKRLATICRRANVPNLTLHMLRHMFGSILFRRGIDIVTVSKLMGHQSPTVTLSVYIDVLNEMKSDSVNVFDKY